MFLVKLLQDKLGLRLIKIADHKHFGDGGQRLNNCTDHCSRSVPHPSLTAGLLDCVRAHAAGTECGIRAAELAIQVAGRQASLLEPMLCEVPGIGLARAPCHKSKKPLRAAVRDAPPRALEMPVVMAACVRTLGVVKRHL